MKKWRSRKIIRKEPHCRNLGLYDSKLWRLSTVSKATDEPRIVKTEGNKKYIQI